MHGAEILWDCDGDFAENTYSRGHLWRFDGGVEVAASASPGVVPRPHALDAAVDPEEAFIASISSCHMLWFLDFARQAGWWVRRYHDQAQGALVNRGGVVMIPKVILTVTTEWEGDVPSIETQRDLHDRAHQACFIANSVKTEIVVQIAEDTT